MGSTTRVELKDGGWAEVRLTRQLRDTAEIRHAVHARGFEDDLLDAFVRLRVRIVEWSRGEVTDDAVLSLDEDDAATLFRVINGVNDPNPSSPSSNGTRRTKAKNETIAETPRGNGE